MLRLIGLLRIYKVYGIKMKFIVFTPFGFWYLAENLLNTTKYTDKTLNSMLLFPVPICGLFALVCTVVRYHRVKVLCLRALHKSKKFSYWAIVPLAFYIILWKGSY